MYKIEKFRVVASLPKELLFLKELAYNLYWSWDHDSEALFRRLDSNLWESCNRNPVALLGSINQNRLENLATDDGFLSHLERVKENLYDHLNRQSWFDKTYPEHKSLKVGYFSMEYGLAKGLPIYSGGLGILAADHLKSASDLGLPLVAVGLLYQEGYFQQYLSKDGWQQEIYPKNDFFNLPITLEKTKDGLPLTISVEFPKRNVKAQVWRAQVGRISLYLLDTNVAENHPDDQIITSQLYGGDNEMRIKQEIILGIGGFRALTTLDIHPTVCHMNEGHSAFLALERAKFLMEQNKDQNLSFEQTKETVRAGTLFTTHTPVPAGIDEFSPDLVDTYLSHYYKSINLSPTQFHQLGGVHLKETNGHFNMAIFAINMAGFYNGVSRLHGKVAREMWGYLWPNVPTNEIPISHITNGVHIRTWISADMAELFNRYLGSKWYRSYTNLKQWSRIQNIPDEELWRTHERRRERLVAVTRHKLKQQLKNSGANPLTIEEANEVLNPEALTIGFARRFAMYKRAYLLFRDKERLLKILTNKDMPVQIIIAGKAHPRDNNAKKIIRDIANIARSEEFRQHIVFVENYDMQTASYLVQGVDVWLNNPVRPREASGTSGMKAGANGALNLSIPDGWWDEAYQNNMGWSIGLGESYQNAEEQDMMESEALYHLLENEVIPLFYNRRGNGIPRQWVAMMKNSMRKTCPVFNTNRMVSNYLEKFYIPCNKSWEKFSTDHFKTVQELLAWKNNIKLYWNEIKIQNVNHFNKTNVKVGDQIQVHADLILGRLLPDDVNVEVFYGQLDYHGQIINGQTMVMSLAEQKENIFIYKADVNCNHTGQHGLSVRVYPKNDNFLNPHEMGLITWYNE